MTEERNDQLGSAISPEDARELVEQFRERAKFVEHAADNETAAELCRQNADALEELIEDA